MNIPRRLNAVFLGMALALPALSSLAQGPDRLSDILDEEIKREMQVLGKQDPPVYYLSYRVDDISTVSVSASFGALTRSDEAKARYLTLTVRVGSPTLDNFHQIRGQGNYAMLGMADLPLTDDRLAIRQVLWSATSDAYQQAVATLSKVKANIAVKAEEEDKSPDFWLGQPNLFLEPPLKPEEILCDKGLFEKRLKKYSAAFLNDPAIFSGSSGFDFQIIRKYFVSSSGDKIAQNSTGARISVSGVIKARDGMELPLMETYFAFKPTGLTSDETVLNDVNRLVTNLVALKEAPIAEPYSGPALLSGKAAGVFFHEIFGHRVEGQRMKNEDDSQTFKKKVNELVLPAHLSVRCDPQAREFAGQALNGFYLYDDQGCPGRRVNVVENGILKGFLMSRTPIDGFPESNGHGRAQCFMQPVARQSNLIVETSRSRTQPELRAEVVALAKAQHKPYAYYFDEVVGGFTQTGRFMPNAFNVTPTLVYRVYTDGRPDEVVRGVDLIGTPLSMFSQIDQAGGPTEVFNGVCGAESGGVPVSAICPMLVVKTIETQKRAKSQERPILLPRPDVKPEPISL